MIAIIRTTLQLVPSGFGATLILMIPLMIASALAETVGLALIMPLVAALSNPENPAAALPPGRLGDALRLMTAAADLTVMAVWVAGFYLVKNAFLLFAAWFENRFIFRVINRAVTDELALYLRAPYPFHLQTHSTELVRNLTRSVEDVYRGVLRPTLKLASEGLVVLGVALLLMINEPKVSAAVAVFLGGSVYLLHRATRQITIAAGRDLQNGHFQSLHLLTEILGSIKELTILQRGGHFLTRYARLRAGLSSVYVKHQTVIEVPRLSVETILVIGFALALMLMKENGGAALPNLALYAMAGFRLMPAMNRILLYVNNVRFGAPAVNAVQQHRAAMTDLAAHLPDEDQGDITFEQNIRLIGANYSYVGAEKQSLTDIDLTIHHGETIGIVGASGAGKTTLADMLLGLLTPTKGKIQIDDCDLLGRRHSWQRKIGYIPQSIFLADASLRNNIAFGIDDDQIDPVHLAEAARLAQLDTVIAGLPQGLDTIIGENGARLSGGQRQRVGIARALYHRPQVLMLDEATSALDNETEHGVAEAVRSLSGRLTIIIIAHRLSTVRHCGRILFMEDGRIVDSGTFAELKARNPQFQKLVALGGLGLDPPPNGSLS